MPKWHKNWKVQIMHLTAWTLSSCVPVYDILWCIGNVKNNLNHVYQTYGGWILRTFFFLTVPIVKYSEIYKRHTIINLCFYFWFWFTVENCIWCWLGVSAKNYWKNALSLQSFKCIYSSAEPVSNKKLYSTYMFGKCSVQPQR